MLLRSSSSVEYTPLCMDVFSSRADPVRASLFIAAVKELLAEVCTYFSRLFLPRLAPRLSFFSVVI